MSITRERAVLDLRRFGEVLRSIAADADDLDHNPAFPARAMAGLGECGLLGLTLADGDGQQPASLAEELSLLRAVARADGSVGRILDGHLNAVERVSASRPGTLSDSERAAIAAGDLRLGVWGADPAPGEGAPARLIATGSEHVLEGVKTFCSGAGGLDRALVVARDAADQRRLAYVDLSRETHIDRHWYRGEGLRASESHRVQFTGARVLAVLGGADEVLRQPWFARDAIRTSATWAGIADGLTQAATELLAQRGPPGELVSLSVARMHTAQGTIDRWLDHAAERADQGAALQELSVHARAAIASACREIIAETARSCGSRPLATGGAISRGRRDLDLFLQQHRLDPILARVGAATLEAART